MIAFRIVGLIFSSGTGSLAPLAPSKPSRVPSRASRTLAWDGPCASRPSRLHEYQKNGPATAEPTAKAPTNTTTQAAAICSPRFSVAPGCGGVLLPCDVGSNVAGGFRLRAQCLNSLANRPCFGGSGFGSGAGGSGSGDAAVVGGGSSSGGSI